MFDLAVIVVDGLAGGETLIREIVFGVPGREIRVEELPLEIDATLTICFLSN